LRPTLHSKTSRYNGGMRIFLVFVALTLIACGGNGGTSSNPPPPAGPTLTAIYDVQGAGETSPLISQDVTVEGVVSGDFQEGDADTARNLGGFYIQGVPDADFATSDGVFIFDGNSPATDVDVGDVVRVTGTVSEYFGETQINASAVSVLGAGAIQAVPINLPVAASTTNSDGELIADLERYEGMLITFPQALTVSQLRNLGRFGEMLLSEGGRQYSFTNQNVPDVAGNSAHVEAIALRRIHLDDGLRSENSGAVLPIRNGDEIANLTGVLRFSRGSRGSGSEAYRLMPTIEPQFESVNPRPAAPAVGGSLHIATFNLNNYFSTVDTGQRICGPSGEFGCRGADSAEELTRQHDKIITALTMMDADIVAVIELENNASDSTQSVVDGLNARAGAGTFDFVDTGTIGTDAIKVGLLYKPAVVQPVGAFAVLDNSVDVRFQDNRHRPVLAQTFETVSGAERFTVLALHLKAKGSSCDSSGDPDIGDGQGNCSATRAMAAAAMIDWIATDPTSSGDADYLVAGDFNTHIMGDAMTLFEGAGYINVAETLIGANTYSFEFDGRFGALDHAMASPGLAAKVVDAAEWHINADEARLNDYNLEFGRDSALFDPANPYRASDHDPLIIGIDF
jgi:predicted extracellular nuclease